MRAKVTIREEKQHATIAETTTDKGIQTKYEGMRVKLNKTFFEKNTNRRMHGIAKQEITVRLLSALSGPDIWKNWHCLPAPLFYVGSRMPKQFPPCSVLTATNGACFSTLKKH